MARFVTNLAMAKSTHGRLEEEKNHRGAALFLVFKMKPIFPYFFIHNFCANSPPNESNKK